MSVRGVLISTDSVDSFIDQYQQELAATPKSPRPGQCIHNDYFDNGEIKQKIGFSFNNFIRQNELIEFNLNYCIFFSYLNYKCGNIKIYKMMWYVIK